MYQNAELREIESDDIVLSTAARQIVATGLKGLTLRTLARNTGISPSLLTYRYGSRDNLLLSVFKRARLQEEASWARRSAELKGLASRREQLTGLCLAIVTGIACQNTLTATLGWIGQVASERLTPLEQVTAGAPRTACTFWAERFDEMAIDPALAPSFSAGLQGAIRIGLLAGTDTRLWTWLNEVVLRLCERTAGLPLRSSGDSAARSALESLGVQQSAPRHESRTETPERIIETASALILSHGPDALTHRLIAKNSGVSLSSMTHHFGSLDEIMARAFDRIYTRASRESSIGLPPTSTIDSMCATILPDIFERARRRGSENTAMDEIILASSRSPGGALFAGALLAMTGRTSTALLQSIETVGDRADRLDGQIFRFVLTGLSEQAMTLPAPERDAWMTDQCRQFLQACWAAHRP